MAAAVLTKAGNIYLGVCIDTAASLGMCAERNAIANMITNGESQIDKVAAVMPDGTVGPPCCACREFMMQLAHTVQAIMVLSRQAGDGADAGEGLIHKDGVDKRVRAQAGLPAQPADLFCPPHDALVEMAVKVR